MDKITFNPNVIDNISKLCQIQPQMIFNKKEIDGTKYITLRANDACHTIFIKMKSKVENFDFIGDEITFLDYNKFYSFYQKLKVKEKEQSEDGKQKDVTIAPDIEMSTDSDGIADVIKITSKNGASFKQCLGNSDVVIKPIFNDIDLNTVNASFKLDKDTFADLSRMCGVLNAETIKFKTNGENVDVVAYNSITKDEYKITYPLISSNEPVDMTISGRPFTLIPDDGYVINIDNGGMIEFKLDDNELYDLDIYIGEKD